MAILVKALSWDSQLIQDGIHQRITAQMLALGKQVVQIAERLAPKKTGRLAQSISFDFNQADFRLVFVVEAPYGMFQEYGTRHIRPHPYMRPALNMVGPIYGIQTELAFANLPPIHAPITTSGRDYHLPTNLTARQVSHVRKHLVPAMKRHHIGNVSRAKVHIRHYPGDL